MTLYVPGSDGTDDNRAADVADAMREGGCRVPRELAEAVRRAGGADLGVPAGDGRRPPREDPPAPAPPPVRRVRHAEVVLADMCLVAHGRTWLRLRWPGEQGGLAGFVAVGRADTSTSSSLGDVVPLPPDGDEDGIPGDPAAGRSGPSSSPPSSGGPSVLCRETGARYPSTPSMRLLDLYDDGLGAPITPEDEGRDGREALEESLLGSYETGEVSCLEAWTLPLVCDGGPLNNSYRSSFSPPLFPSPAFEKNKICSPSSAGSAARDSTT